MAMRINYVVEWVPAREKQLVLRHTFVDGKETFGSSIS